MSCVTSLLPEQKTEWISYELYNKFPEVDTAREQLPIEEQTALAKSVSQIVPNLGVTITHGHHILRNQKSRVIGTIKGNSLTSKIDHLSENICPTTWVVTSDRVLVATEGVTNPSPEILEIAKKVGALAEKLIPHFSPCCSEGFSRYSITIDPSILLNIKQESPEELSFIETNEEETSLLQIANPLNPIQESSILTSISYFNDKTNKLVCRVFCHGNDRPNNWNHYKKHYQSIK
jgi:hypothetical protein